MMKSVCLSDNPEEVRDILLDKDVWASGVFGDIPDGLWFVLRQDEITAGIINLRSINSVLWVPHIYIHKKYRGKGSEKWGKLVASYMIKKMGAKKFLVLTPHETAKRYAERVGFKYVGELKLSVELDGELLNQYMLEM